MVNINNKYGYIHTKGQRNKRKYRTTDFFMNLISHSEKWAKK